MGFAVFHIAKGKGSAGGLGGHIDRTYKVLNADKHREHLNFQLRVRSDNGKKVIVRKKGIGLYEGTINARESAVVQKGHTGRKVRDNAVTRLHFVLSGSHEDMKKLEKEGKILEWAEDNLRYMGNTFGTENIIEFAVHMDERTPHIHAIVVPINRETKTLNAKSLMSRKQLKGYQTDYAKAMSKYGLQRGRAGSRAKHETVKEFYATIDQLKPKQHIYRSTNAIEDLKDQVNPKFTESKSDVLDRAQEIFNNILRDIDQNHQRELKAALGSGDIKNRKQFREDIYRTKMKDDKQVQELIKHARRFTSVKKKDLELINSLKSALKHGNRNRVVEHLQHWIDQTRNRGSQMSK